MSIFRVYNRAARLINTTRLRDAFLNADLVREPGFVNGVVMGLIRDKLDRFDEAFTEEVLVAVVHFDNRDDILLLR